MLAMESIHHRILVHPEELTVGHGRCRTHAQNLACQRALAKKIPFTHDTDRRFFAGGGNHGEYHFAFLDVEHRVRRIALSEYRFLFSDNQHLPAITDGGEECPGIKLTRLPGGGW